MITADSKSQFVLDEQNILTAAKTSGLFKTRSRLATQIVM